MNALLSSCHFAYVFRSEQSVACLGSACGDSSTKQAVQVLGQSPFPALISQCLSICHFVHGESCYDLSSSEIVVYFSQSGFMEPH